MRQFLSERSVRRYARHTGLDIDWMDSRGGRNHWHQAKLHDGRFVWIHANTYEVKEQRSWAQP